MKRKLYQKPTTEVANLQQHHQIMTGSQGVASTKNYYWHDLTEE
jgi:hypothetical protein